MKKLYIITAILLCAASLQAAQLYYQFPTATTLKNSDRIMVFQNSSANRNPAFGHVSSANITGATLKRLVNTNPAIAGDATVSGNATIAGSVSANVITTLDNTNAFGVFVGRHSVTYPYSYLGVTPTSSGLSILNAAQSANTLVVLNSGNVLIGQGGTIAETAGAEKLQITGNVLATSTIAAGSGTNIIYYCDAGINAGLLGRGNAGPCSGGTWVATSLRLD